MEDNHQEGMVALTTKASPSSQQQGRDWSLGSKEDRKSIYNGGSPQHMSFPATWWLLSTCTTVSCCTHLCIASGAEDKADKAAAKQQDLFLGRRPQPQIHRPFPPPDPDNLAFGPNFPFESYNAGLARIDSNLYQDPTLPPYLSDPTMLQVCKVLLQSH
jgi:hypothetical protein